MGKNRAVKFLDRRFLIGKPSQQELHQQLRANPAEVASILDRHLDHRSYQILSRRIPDGDGRFEFEWLMNPFQYARQAIRDEQLFEFATYLNGSQVWANAAPHFLDSAAFTQVMCPMLERCAEDRAQALAERLNANGLLATCFAKRGYSSETTLREWRVAV